MIIAYIFTNLLITLAQVIVEVVVHVLVAIYNAVKP